MGLNFRKSIKLGGGVRLNLSKRGVGVSAGVKGLRVGTGPGGTRMRASLPGTGIYYEKRLGTSRRSSRVADQKRQELIARQREQEKMAELERARYEVEVFENRLEVIVSVHKDSSETYDWESIKNSSPPFDINEPGPKEKVSREILNQFKPSWRDRLFNRVEIRKKSLYEKIDLAKEEDLREYKELEMLVNSADNVLRGDIDTYMNIIKEFSPFSEISELGSKVLVSTDKPNYLEITIHVHSDDVIPNVVKSLTKTGKVSVKNMPKTRYYELYQDYVCSCILRVAREAYAILPVQSVYVHALGEILNTSTGHMEESPILSVMIPRETLNSFNFEDIDCSDSMDNFVHNMKFRKTKGFEIVDKINPKTIEKPDKE